MSARDRIPIATYRLQLNRSFTFRDAAAIVPYLSALGISHCYLSPYLRARPGSMHGYDIIDHNALNPEIGSAEDYEYFVSELHRHGMGQILDIVPNHMGVMGSDNAWWIDVLENGEASNYADYFDIDWDPIKDELQGKVLLPILDDQYGNVLEKGELNLAFDAGRGEFSILYHQHHLPIDPAEYPRILTFHLDRLQQKLSSTHDDFLELQSITTAFSHLPPRRGLSEQQRAERNREKEVQKRRLSALYGRSPEIKDFLTANIEIFNGDTRDPRSFDNLHELIKAQVYRLAHWRAAADDINYRRFFDINDLAALRMENEAVFRDTHRYILDLMKTGKVDGLRIDHPDGLYDPAKYFRQLKEEISKVRNSDAGEAYVIVEKILTASEQLRKDWPVDGTTGYEFSDLVNGLFVDAGSADAMTQIYRSFTGRLEQFGDLVYACKKLILKVVLASELNVLANLLIRIALANRHTCDFTLNSLRSALAEIISSFPVYRTYVNGAGASVEDRQYIEKAVAAGRKRSNAADLTVFDFIRSVLLVEANGNESVLYKLRITRFAMKFQQVTSSVMAKGEEDTAFYRYNRLVSLNEVGGDPDRFGTTVEQFHDANQKRLDDWPNSMLSSSTHDSKRSEDVRARINAISEMPHEWRRRLSAWREWNQSKKRSLDGEPAPTRNDEYLLYQTLLGAWPSEALNDAGWKEFSNRIEQYMLKAVREAKEHTSWANTNADYENALSEFVKSILKREPENQFLADFEPFQHRIARIGMFNSLSQCLLKLTSPGVPDIYQGNELWQFSLVDPDNRRPVDYEIRKKSLQDIQSASHSSQALAGLAASLMSNLNDGRAKLFLTASILAVRKEDPALFQQGKYIPLQVTGPRSKHVIAFARKFEERTAIVVAPRLCSSLVEENHNTLCDEDLWEDTLVQLDDVSANYRDILTWELISAGQSEQVSVGKLLRSFPVAFLLPQQLVG